jgi:hypothetical protein
MKALLASTLTALVLVTTAWASTTSSVTPAQLAAISKRVAKLEKDNRSLRAAVNQATSVVDRQNDVVGCLRAAWNAQGTAAYAVSTWGGFDTKSGNLNLLVAPATDDGIAGTGYLVTTQEINQGC